MGASWLPLYVIVWVSLFTRNTQRDVPYSCSTVPHPVRNVALPVPVGSNRFTIIFCCMGDFINTEHPKGCSLQLFYHTKPNEQENYLPPFRFNKQITDGISHGIYCLLIFNISKNGPPPYASHREARLSQIFKFYFLQSFLASGIYTLHFAFTIGVAPYLFTASANAFLSVLQRDLRIYRPLK